ncbi:MAG TPA: sigma-70 family RNA polymerase sigma factor [Candidatus Polarisedimenticolia bacterium]|nr:sigma-70 family RNA polymerase sigma factor [Candidatus Polarisedimenticolia bacterium]
MTESIAAAQDSSRCEDEASLVAAARDGDREAFGRLYARFSRMVHGILLARVPRHVADDLAQDAFLKAIVNLHALRDLGSFGPWLAAIARSQAQQYHRSARAEDPLVSETAAPGSALAEALEALAVIRALPEAYRETLVLRLLEGMTGPEIAERTGLTPGSVRVNLHRGMKLLREKLKGTRLEET